MTSGTVRVAALQPARRLVDWKQDDPARALAQVEENLDALAALLVRAAEDGCQAVCFPEDTLGLGKWEDAHDEAAARTLLPPATDAMLRRFGDLARRQSLYVVCCADFADEDGVANTAVLLSPSGTEIGRYRKVHLPLQEQTKVRGTRFPVFETPDLGTVGMCICYDLVFPETSRALALAGAGLVFHPTLGGAAFGDEDISRAAFRTRAVDNGLYLISARRAGGSLLVGPKGQILADGGDRPDAIVHAEIDVSGGRDLGDALGGTFPDLRARLFRERVPDAYAVLACPEPPILATLPPIPDAREVARTASEAHTVGEERFNEAEHLRRTERTDEAMTLFRELAARYPTTWIHEAARTQLTTDER